MLKVRNPRTIRIVSLLLALTVVFSLIPQVSAYGESSNWAKDELDEMMSQNLLPPYFQELDSLKDDVTRLEMCIIAVHVFETYIGDEISVENPTPFTDSDDIILAKAYAMGLVNGYEDGTFRPDRLLSRQEFFVFVEQFLYAAGWTPSEEHFADLSRFADADQLSSWARDAASLVVGIQVVEGNEVGLSPARLTTGEQALVMFYRAYQFLCGQDGFAPPTSGEPHPPVEPGVPFEQKYPNMSNWAKEELVAMDKQGLIPQLLTGRDMKSSITRREMCYVAVNAYLAIRPDTDLQASPSPFSDVKDNTVTLAHKLGIVDGFPDGTFLPDNPITKEQFFKISSNFLEVLGYPETDDVTVDLSRFQDAEKLHNYALSSTRLLVGLGIVKGDGDRLHPQKETSCQEALALFFRSYNFFVNWQPEEGLPGSRPMAEELVAYALQFEGWDYVWGGSDPDIGFDCSGLVYHVFGKFGFDLGRTATDQWESKVGTEVSLLELLPGDLLFFSPTQSVDDITHIGIYVGDNQFIHAANSRRGVVVDSTETSYFETECFKAKRIIPQ